MINGYGWGGPEEPSLSPPYAGARVLLGPRARMRPMDGPISLWLSPAAAGTPLCAWGNDAASEVIPRRVNCWLKTISKPPLRPSRATENFWEGSL